MIREVREIADIGEWLDWRRQDITASVVAAAFDEHPYMTRADLMAEKRMPRALARKGNILEPAVAAALSEAHPDWRLKKATTYHRLPDHRLGCTPDYWLGDNRLVQIKTVNPFEWGKWRGRPPLAYTLQTLTELLVTGRERGVLAVMVCSPSFPVHEFDVPRHPDAEGKILDAVAEWWRAFDAGEIAPPAPSLAADLDDGSHVDLSGDNELAVLLPERERLKSEVSKAEARLKEIDHTIKNRIGPARTAWLPGWSMTFATQNRKETVIPAKDIRVLRVKATEEANGQ